MKAVTGRVLLTTVAIVGSLWATAAQIKAADEIVFTYHDPYGLEAIGLITVVPSGLNDGSLLAVSGDLEIIANPQYLPAPDISSQFPPNHYVGHYRLLKAGPETTTFFNGQTSADNLFFPDEDASTAVNGDAVPGDFVPHWRRTHLWHRPCWRG